MRQIVAILVSVAGTAMVFGLLLLMNAEAKPPEAEASTRAIAMEVAPKPPPPKKKNRPKPKKAESNPRPTAPPPPMPNLGAGLSSVSLGMPAAEVDFDTDGARELLGDLKSTTMTEDSVDSKPRPTRRPAAAYPPRARAKNVTGFVTMSLLINERGAVERIKVLRADPPGVFEEAAKTSVRDWAFEPATYGGEAVKVWATQTIRFELK